MGINPVFRRSFAAKLNRTNKMLLLRARASSSANATNQPQDQASKSAKVALPQPPQVSVLTSIKHQEQPFELAECQVAGPPMEPSSVTSMPSGYAPLVSNYQGSAPYAAVPEMHLECDCAGQAEGFAASHSGQLQLAQQVDQYSAHPEYHILDHTSQVARYECLRQ